MAKRKNQDKEYKTKDYVVYFIVAFVLIFLTSSFVIEDIYSSSENIVVNPEGVKAVYQSSIGDAVFNDAAVTVDESQNTDNQSAPTPTTAPTTTTAPSTTPATSTN